MSEQNLAPVMDDMELISLYVNEQLPGDQMERVRERLNTDDEFRYLAEPIMFATALLRQQMSRPRPPGELEKQWEKFTRRASFTHQKMRARARRWWIVAILLALPGITGLLGRQRIQSAYRDWRDYAPVAHATGWIRLRDHIEVRLEPGARMRASKEVTGNAQRVKLTGVAHFRVRLVDTTDITVPRMTPVVVLTRGGTVFSGYGDFSVATSGDTTIVEDHRLEKPLYAGFMPFPSMTMVRSDEFTDPVRVQQDTRVRLVPGSPPARMR